MIKVFLARWWPWLIGLVLLCFAGLLLGAYQRGRTDERAVHEAKMKDMQIALHKAQAKQAEVVTKVATEYVDRVKVVHQKGDTIIKEVPTYVPITTPDLPGSFRVLFDAAVQNELPDPARVPDAAPVSAQDVATTVVDNYTTCNLYREQIAGLQKLLLELKAANDG